VKISSPLLNLIQARSAAKHEGQPPGEQVVLLRDDMESENENWLLRGPWTRVQTEDHGKVFADNAGAGYEANANVRLVSQPILLNVHDPRLEFDLKFDTQPGVDPVTVEIAENHHDKTLRHNWVELARFSGQSGWGSYALALNGWEDREVQFRFRLQSDATDQRQGLLVDNVLLSGQKPPTQG